MVAVAPQHRLPVGFIGRGALLLGVICPIYRCLSPSSQSEKEHVKAPETAVAHIRHETRRRDCREHMVNQQRGGGRNRSHPVCECVPGIGTEEIPLNLQHGQGFVVAKGVAQNGASARDMNELGTFPGDMCFPRRRWWGHGMGRRERSRGGRR